jgi:hypothetical protein
MVFVVDKHSGKSAASPASMVSVGDTLTNGKTVTSIRHVTRKGVYAPYTPSGTIVLTNHGVVASTYISFQGSHVLKFGDAMETHFTYQWIAHAFQAPHRMWSHWLGGKELKTNGISPWAERPLQVGLWFLNQHPAVMGLLAVPLVFYLVTMSTIETVFFVHPELSLLVVMILVLWGAMCVRLSSKKRNYSKVC